MLEVIIGYNINEHICVGKLIKIYAPLSELGKSKGQAGTDLCFPQGISGDGHQPGFALGNPGVWSWEEQGPFGPSVC